MIWIPCPVEQLPTHTSRFTVDASAVNLMKELFSILPQNSPVSPQSPKPKKPHDFDQELTVYEDEVFPQYPFKSHKIGRHTSELQSRPHLVCRLLLEKK